jgi:hypothetical protein
MVPLSELHPAGARELAFTGMDFLMPNKVGTLVEDLIAIVAREQLCWVFTGGHCWRKVTLSSENSIEI